ncbi:hypothetical protein HF086_004194 [Spodoptera exigua]|uniref:G-patch domain-containing protein n=1 Tax=Spodoptera exigua TaxID=7107 RepID=A0A922MLQ6_SPOEX|nr:hypothetical protein HF086_004194 [Spodoptera exigua]
MSDDEVMRFEITDYDLDNEFNPNRNRRAKKEHQIYGVWAKDSDEEDNEDNIRQRTRKPKDFSAPIGFVAGGVQQAGKKKEESKEIESSEASTSRPKFADSSDEEEQNAPDASETAGIRRQGQGMRPVNLGGNVGTWEKHTKGMGLGKDLQGISAPVEATVRRGRGAIGAYGPEKAAQKAKKEEELRRLKEKEEEKGPKEKNYNWKKSHKGRYFYRDAADVIQEGKPSMHTITSSELSRVPVIDMTGKEKRVLSGYHALRAAAPRFEHEPRRQCQNFAAPQLVHNLMLMETYPLEYDMFGLGTIAGNIVSPLLSSLLAPWEPLQAPDEPVPTFLKKQKTEIQRMNSSYHEKTFHSSEREVRYGAPMETLKPYFNQQKMFPEEVLKEPAVRDAFRKALDMMNRSADIDAVEPPPPPRFAMPEPKETSRIADVITTSAPTKSFSELLETRCIEKGITFVPIPGKTREGRPIYKIGHLQCYVIRNVIMFSDDNGRIFSPISLDKLLNMVE